MAIVKSYPTLTADEVAAGISDGVTVAFSGFSPAGAAKAVPRALAQKARRLHKQGQPFKIRVLTGASTGEDIDDALAEAEAIAWRAPYQGSPLLRRQINAEQVEYVDMHLSHVPQTVLFGFFGKIDYAVVEATEITSDGRVYLTTSIGASPTYLRCAEKIIIEINRHQSVRLREMADIMMLPPPPHRVPIPIHEPTTKVGWPYALADPQKVIAIVETDEPDYMDPFGPPDDSSQKIAKHVVRFLLEEMLL